jgi:hypothetical protein
MGFTIVLTYCAACWLLMVVMTFIWAPQFAARAAARGVNPLTFQLGAVLAAPLAMPLVFWLLLHGLVSRILRLRELRYCLKTVREYEFVHVNTLYLDDSIRGLFERHTPDLFQLGFNLLGDFRMKSKPVEVHDRFLLSADGETLAAVCAVLGRGSPSLISILSNGVCIHTSGSKNPKPERTFEPQDRLCLTYLPGVSLEEQFREHQHILHEQCARHGASVIHQHADQFRQVMIYDQRLFNRWRFRHGDLSAQPPAPNFGAIQQAPLALADA